MTVTRFAPSPNGPLHLGHAYSAIVAHDLARARGGRFLLRIEDIDGARSRVGFADDFRADLAWLGLEWEEVPAQSQRLATYADAARRLREMGLLYPCHCTRAEIAAATAARALAMGAGGDGGAGSGVDGPLYPGTCRGASFDPASGPAGGPAGGPSGGPAAWRLDVGEALRRTGPLVWIDENAAEQRASPERAGDVVLVRKDVATPASYHLAVTLDDAADAVTLVTRGMDLFAASSLHRLLQALLDLPVPVWHHHPLLLDSHGQKLAKRRGSGLAGFGLAERRRAGGDGREFAAALREGRLPPGVRFSRTGRSGFERAHSLDGRL